MIDTIPALTLYPQWAYAVAHLGKRIENRDWHEGTPQLAEARRLVGKRILIHAAKGCGTRAEFTAAVLSILDHAPQALHGLAVMETGRVAAGAYKRCYPAASLPRMALVARATLADVVMTKPTGHAFHAAQQGMMDGLPCRWCGAHLGAGDAWTKPCPNADPWATPGVGLVLADVEALAEPVPYPGRQGWFRVPAEVVS